LRKQYFPEETMHALKQYGLLNRLGDVISGARPKAQFTDASSSRPVIIKMGFSTRK